MTSINLIIYSRSETLIEMYFRVLRPMTQFEYIHFKSLRLKVVKRPYSDFYLKSKVLIAQHRSKEFNDFFRWYLEITGVS